jgi:hypothetical protein
MMPSHRFFPEAPVVAGSFPLKKQIRRAVADGDFVGGGT